MSGLGIAATSRLRDQRQELRDVVVVHRMHRGEVRAGDPAPQARAAASRRPAVSMWRDSGSSVSSQCMSTISPRSAAISQSSRDRARCRRPSSARNAGCRRRRRRPCRARGCVLSRARRRAVVARPAGRRRAAGRYRARRRCLTSSSASTAEQPVVADVDMGADREQAHRHRPVAIGERPLLHRLVRQQRLQLAPERDAFEQRARRVDARQAVGKRRVHVEMRVDEGRRHEAARRRRRRGPPRRRAAARSPRSSRRRCRCRPRCRRAACRP